MKRQIMLVDDENGMLDLIGLVLQRQGFSVLKAKDAFTALALLESSTPDLFVLDVMMSKMSGIELCRRIRERPETSETPVVMLSARTDSDARVSRPARHSTCRKSRSTVSSSRSYAICSRCTTPIRPSPA